MQQAHDQEVRKNVRPVLSLLHETSYTSEPLLHVLTIAGHATSKPKTSLNMFLPTIVGIIAAWCALYAHRCPGAIRIKLALTFLHTFRTGISSTRIRFVSCVVSCHLPFMISIPISLWTTMLFCELHWKNLFENDSTFRRVQTVISKPCSSRDLFPEFLGNKRVSCQHRGLCTQFQLHSVFL